MVSTEAAAGALLGLACGDALGRPVEFRSARRIAAEHGRVTDMLGYGTHRQPAGTITDDTELALCIARSLAERGRFDGEDVADRFRKWYASDPFDVGLMTVDAIRELERGTSWRNAGHEVWKHRPEGKNAGNGSVMRCVPYAIAFAEAPDALATVSRQSSAITHYDPRCTEGCVLFNATIAGYLRGANEPFPDARAALPEDAPEELREALSVVPDGVEEGDLRTTGYVVHTLQTALHDALSAETVEEAIVTAVNRGGDTDTVGAVTGAIAGARFGAGSLPERWLDALDRRAELDELARTLATKPIAAP